MTPPLFSCPIPASRATVPTGYGYVLPDQNGWSRYLHFQTAWAAGADRHRVPPRGRVERALPQTPAAATRATVRGGRCRARSRSTSAARRPVAERRMVVQRAAAAHVPRWSIFVLFPLVIWTGLAMSPAFNSAFPSTVTLLGGRQSARTLHFFVSDRARAVPGSSTSRWSAGGIPQPDARDDHRRRSAGERSAHERNLPAQADHAGLAAAGPSGLAARRELARRYGLVPPDHGGIYGPGETLTYAAQRLLTPHSLAREFSRSQISKPPFANETAPPSDDFKRLQAAGFADWRLVVDGLVAQPASLSLDDLQTLSGPQPDHRSRVRRRLVVHRRVDRHAARTKC